MFENVKKLFGLDYESKYRKELESYTAKLPVPPSQIVICSKRYKPNEFNCESSVYTPDLLEWLKDHYSRCSVSFYAETLLLWLPKANIRDDRSLYLPLELLRAIEGYEDRIINGSRSSIRCGICNHLFETIEQKYENVVDVGSNYSGTIVWECPNGHEIYRHNFQYHVLRART